MLISVTASSKFTGGSNRLGQKVDKIIINFMAIKNVLWQVDVLISLLW